MNKVKKYIYNKNSISAIPQKQNARVYYLIIFLTAFLLYANTIPNKFSFDDDYVTYNNAQIKKGLKGIPDIFTTRYSLKENHTFGYRPIAKVTFAIEYQIFRENPHVSHFLNILLYALTGIFLFILLKKIFSKYNSFVLLVSTLLFLAHPVHTEVVASLKNREEILSFLFSILSLITLINYVKNKKLISLFSSIIFFILAILSKLNAATIVMIVPLALYYSFEDIKIYFPFKSLFMSIKSDNKVVLSKIKLKKEQKKISGFNPERIVMQKANLIIGSYKLGVSILGKILKKLAIALSILFMPNLIIISGFVVLFLLSYNTNISLPMFISSFVGIYFLCKEKTYEIKDVIRSKYFIGILFILSFFRFQEFIMKDILFEYFKYFEFILVALFIILLINVLRRKYKRERKLFYDFFSNKYLILFHIVFSFQRFVFNFIYGKYNIVGLMSLAVLIIFVTIILIVYSWIKKEKVLQNINEHKWFIAGLSLFLDNTNSYISADIYMLREFLYLSSLIIVIVFFYFERNSMKDSFIKVSFLIKAFLKIVRSVFIKTSSLIHKIFYKIFKITIINIPKPVNKVLVLIKKYLPAIPKPFIFIYRTSRKFYIAINPYFKLLLLLSIVFVVIAYFSVKTPDRYLPPEKIKGAVTILQNPLHYELNTGNRTATGLKVLLFYLQKAVFPHPLLFYYGYNMIPVVGWKNITVIISLIIHLLLIAIAIAGIKKKSVFSFGIIFYLISISIFSNLIVPVNGIVGERFLFVSSIGLILLLVFLIFKIFKTDIFSLHFDFNKNVKPLIILSLIFVCYSYKTIDRNTDWKDHLSLYSSDIKYLENSARANVIYAGTMYGELFSNLQPGQNISPEQIYKAGLIVKHYKQGLKIDPTFSNAWNNLGLTYVLVYKSTDQGLECFKKAIKYDSTNYETYFNLGYSYELIHDSIKAEKSYRKSIDINIQYPKSFMSLNKLLMRQNRYKDVAEINNQLIKANPKLDIPYINLGNIFLLQFDTTKCLTYWEIAFNLNPENISNCTNLLGIYQMKKNIKKSSYYSEQINRIREKNH